jgi:hypothetical protein
MTDSTEEREKHKSCTYDDRVLPNYGTGEARAKDENPMLRELNIEERTAPL